MKYDTNKLDSGLTFMQTTVMTPRAGLMASTLGVLDLSDLVPGGSQPDAAGPPSPVRKNELWTVRIDDSAVNVAAPAIPVSGSSVIAQSANKLPVDDNMAAETPVVSADVSRVMTSPEGGVAKDNRTSIDEGR